jgi:hypothetical protein
MTLRAIAWTVLKKHDDHGDAYQACALTRATVGGELGPLRYFADATAEEPAYRLAEADGVASGLPYAESFGTHPPSAVAPGAVTRQPAAPAAAPTSKPTGVTYAASYGTPVIETPPAQPAEMTTSSFSYSPTFGKR